MHCGNQTEKKQTSEQTNKQTKKEVKGDTLTAVLHAHWSLLFFSLLRSLAFSLSLPCPSRFSLLVLRAKNGEGVKKAKRKGERVRRKWAKEENGQTMKIGTIARFRSDVKYSTKNKNKNKRESPYVFTSWRTMGQKTKKRVIRACSFIQSSKLGLCFLCIYSFFSIKSGSSLSLSLSLSAYSWFR